ncbi:MAG: glycosyltransferase, partial [Cyclobacteriaceae bacterium]
CPVVAYMVGGIPDLIVQGETGYLVDQGNEQLMVDYAIQILDPAYQPQIEKIKKNASALVQDHYRNAQIAHRFEQTYTQLTSQTL